MNYYTSANREAKSYYLPLPIISYSVVKPRAVLIANAEANPLENFNGFEKFDHRMILNTVEGGVYFSD